MIWYKKCFKIQEQRLMCTEPSRGPHTHTHTHTHTHADPTMEKTSWHVVLEEKKPPTCASTSPSKKQPYFPGMRPTPGFSPPPLPATHNHNPLHYGVSSVFWGRYREKRRGSPLKPRPFIICRGPNCSEELPLCSVLLALFWGRTLKASWLVISSF